MNPAPLPSRLSAEDAAQPPGRVCPLRYRHGPAAIAQAPERQADSLYVIGGLYGNLPALDTLEHMARTEARHGGPLPRLCFNGDFNWFNVDDGAFLALNQRVLAHDALLGNVEAELDSPLDDAGCGCAYPEHVDAGVVERSNRIHALLKATARRQPALLGRLARLPMVARYRVGDCRVGVVHGDAESLAGWRFGVEALEDPAEAAWRERMFEEARVDLFASSHTCLPALRPVPLPRGRVAGLANNGAAGMPNFHGDLSGLCTRIATTPSPHPVVHEMRLGGAWVALLPVQFDAEQWQRDFLAQWPAGSAAWASYFQRISRGPSFTVAQALGRNA